MIKPRSSNTVANNYLPSTMVNNYLPSTMVNNYLPSLLDMSTLVPAPLHSISHIHFFFPSMCVFIFPLVVDLVVAGYSSPPYIEDGIPNTIL
jgi:hypothetical protein